MCPDEFTLGNGAAGSVDGLLLRVSYRPAIESRDVALAYAPRRHSFQQIPEPEIREIKVGFGGGLSIQGREKREHRARQHAADISLEGLGLFTRGEASQDVSSVALEPWSIPSASGSPGSRQQTPKPPIRRTIWRQYVSYCWAAFYDGHRLGMGAGVDERYLHDRGNDCSLNLAHGHMSTTGGHPHGQT
jgi:hypothetical protein